MDFIDKIRELANRIPKQLDYCTTEEATKNALIMPFINSLGYNVFDPTEVVPEYTADIGIKKGEKVDYAIFQDAQPIMFFECKWSGADLTKAHASQLHRYFGAVKGVRFGILTNGVIYRFYSDLDSPNRMDDQPFLEFNMLSFQERHVNELKKFTKATFNLEEILTTANELKYTAAMRRILEGEFDKPSDEFIRFLATQVYSGRMTQSVREQFAIITRKALRRFMNDEINKRLTSALQETSSAEEDTIPEEPSTEEEVESKPKREIVTTEEEIEGYFIVKSILRSAMDVKRVHMRDTKSYCGVLLDDNNRKPICRLRFNREQKYLGLFDESKKESTVRIDGIDDIFNHAEALIATIKHYDS